MSINNDIDINIAIDINMDIDITPPHPMPGPSADGAGGAWGVICDTNNHIDISSTFDTYHY